MKLDRWIRETAETWGADFYGVADLAPAHDAILAQGGPEVAAFPRGISVGIILPHAIVDQLPNRAERAVAIGYRHHAYDVINQRLDHLVSRLSSRLQSDGFRALPIPASKRVDNDRICAAFSHKLAAHLAGLGWIGKSCLLVTLSAGPRVRWATVLTDAPLPATGNAMEERCGECNECVEICPVRAFTGAAFRESEPREKRYDAGKCDRYFEAMRAKDAETAVCGLCLYVCPYGKEQKLEQGKSGGPRKNGLPKKRLGFMPEKC
jgi:epoxyqueuosine reductase